MYLIDAAGRPVRRLVGFRKLELAPGQSAQVEIPIDPRLLAHWDTTARAWRLDPGTYALALADAADEPRLTATIDLRSRVLVP